MASFHIVSCVFTLFCCARADIMTVTFNDPVEIICNDSKVIEMVNMTVSDLATDCPHDSCSLEAKDKEEIQHKCNGHSSCNTSSNLQTNCLKDYGYFSFEYTCREILPSSCNFEGETCGWSDQSKSDYEWTIQKGSTPSRGTGPESDHTLGTPEGTYIYADAPYYSNGHSAILKSEFIQPSNKQCLTFWYHMYGKDIGELNVFQVFNGRNDVIHIWSTSGSKDRQWYYQVINLQEDIGIYEIVFKAEHGNGYKGDIALDDIVIGNNNCKVSEHDCNFETKCMWSTTDEKYQWTLHNGKTNSSNTGPKNDVSTGLSQGHYIYLEASHINAGEHADLFITDVKPRDKSCLTFWYHMYGKDMGALQIFITVGNYSRELWSKYKDQGNKWHQAFVDISMVETYNLTFRGICGKNYRSDIAIDDINLIPQTCSDFQRALSHLTNKTYGDQTYSQTCLNVAEDTEILGCTKNYILFYQSALTFNPRYENCVDVYDEVQNEMEAFCRQTSRYWFCDFDFSSVLQKNPACFMPNKMTFEYICKDLTLPGKEAQLQDGQNKAVTGGIIAGVIILACAVVVLIFVLRRSQHCKREPKPQTKLQNNTVNLAAVGDYRSDYTGNQNIALPNASGHVIQLAVFKDGDQQYDEIGNEEHTYTDIDRMTEEQTRPPYEYVDSETNDCIKRNKQDKFNVGCPPSSKDIENTNKEGHYSFAKEDNLESNITEDYAVLDPNETRFNRSNVITDVAIDAYNKPDRSTNMENDLTTEMEDQYGVSND